MLAKSAKVKSYEQRIKEFRQNRIFHFYLKKMYADFSRVGVRPNNVPNTEKRFWGDIWSIGIGHNPETEWLKDVKNALGND